MTRPVTATFVVAAMVALGAMGCSERGESVFTRLTRPPATPPTDAPKPDSPAAALRLLEWAYNHRDYATLHTLFTEDFRFYFDAGDTAGAAYRVTPWGLEDELASTSHLFVNGKSDEAPASSVTLVLDRNFFVYPDPRFASWDPRGRWHKNIRTQTLLHVLRVDGSALEVSGASSFYFVRGDSALIPEDLKDAGFAPDSIRWWISRWDDETIPAGEGRTSTIPAALTPPILQPQPARQWTWGTIKVLYR